jgi:superfamily I DNA/RNA helicase
MPSFEGIRAAILNNPAAMQMLNGISSRLREERQSGYRRALNQQIDRSQQEFNESDAKKIRLIAPAGAGKTMTIVNRVLYHGSQGVPLQRCLLLTFDRSAQNSLQSRFADATRKTPTAEQPVIQTLNSFGNRFLTNYTRSLGRPCVVKPPRMANSLMIAAISKTVSRN